MQIPKGTDVDWHERKLISKFYMEHVSNWNLTKGRQEILRFYEELDEDAVCHRFCLACTANNLPTKLLKDWKTSELDK